MRSATSLRWPRRGGRRGEGPLWVGLGVSRPGGDGSGGGGEGANAAAAATACCGVVGSREAGRTGLPSEDASFFSITVGKPHASAGGEQCGPAARGAENPPLDSADASAKKLETSAANASAAADGASGEPETWTSARASLPSSTSPPAPVAEATADRTLAGCGANDWSTVGEEDDDARHACLGACSDACSGADGLTGGSWSTGRGDSAA